MHTLSIQVLLFSCLISGCSSSDADDSPGSSDTSETADSSDQTTSPSTEDSGDTDTASDTEDTHSPEATIWTGSLLTFEKADYADPADPTSQDAITDLVVLTRGDSNSLFNVVIEESATSSSPLGTEWARGTTAKLDGLKFDTLKGAMNNQMSNLPGTALVLHLIDENIYIDVTFLSWSSGDSGGGFSYERNTEN